MMHGQKNIKLEFLRRLLDFQKHMCTPVLNIFIIPRCCGTAQHYGFVCQRPGHWGGYSLLAVRTVWYLIVVVVAVVGFKAQVITFRIEGEFPWFKTVQLRRWSWFTTEFVTFCAQDIHGSRPSHTRWLVDKSLPHLSWEITNFFSVLNHQVARFVLAFSRTVSYGVSFTVSFTLSWARRNDSSHVRILLGLLDPWRGYRQALPKRR